MVAVSQGVDPSGGQSLCVKLNKVCEADWKVVEEKMVDKSSAMFFFFL